MTRIQQRIDELIIRLKQLDALSDVRFVREYGNESVEMPVRSVMAVVGIAETTRERGYIGGYLSSSLKGECYGAKVEIRVYSPASENGSGLSELVSELLMGLEKADRENIIISASARSIEFDPDMNAIFRTVEFRIEFCLCEEEQRGLLL